MMVYYKIEGLEKSKKHKRTRRRALTPPPDEERRRMKTSHAILLALVALAFTAALSANAQASVADIPGVVGTAITGAATAPVKSFLCADGTSSGAIDWLNTNSPYRGDGKFSSLRAANPSSLSLV